MMAGASRLPLAVVLHFILSQAQLHLILKQTLAQSLAALCAPKPVATRHRSARASHRCLLPHRLPAAHLLAV
jgi:hypothetical protein